MICVHGIYTRLFVNFLILLDYVTNSKSALYELYRWHLHLHI